MVTGDYMGRMVVMGDTGSRCRGVPRGRRGEGEEILDIYVQTDKLDIWLRLISKGDQVHAS
jgi:hypothetical protein